MPALQNDIWTGLVAILKEAIHRATMDGDSSAITDCSVSFSQTDSTLMVTAALTMKKDGNPPPPSEPTASEPAAPEPASPGPLPSTDPTP